MYITLHISTVVLVVLVGMLIGAVGSFPYIYREDV